MKYTSYLLTVIIVGLFAFGCSTSPNGPDISDQLIEFNALEADLSSLVVDPEPTTDHVITDVNIKRLEKQIDRLKNFLERLARYERKHSNDEAHKLIIDFGFVFLFIGANNCLNGIFYGLNGIDCTFETFNKILKNWRKSYASFYN